MSFSGVGGGFQGGNALLAFAAIQQGRMNEEMTESMRVADLRSQMAGDLADIKAHLEQANTDPKSFPDVDKELQAFMSKYGSEPELQDITSTVGGIADEVHKHVSDVQTSNYGSLSIYAANHARWEQTGKVGDEPLFGFGRLDGRETRHLLAGPVAVLRGRQHESVGADAEIRVPRLRQR